MPLKSDSPSEFISKSASVTQVYTEEIYAHIISLIPTPVTFKANHDNCAASFTGSLEGDPEQVKQFEKHRNAVNEGLTILLGVAKAVTIKDPSVPETLRISALTGKTVASDITLSQPTGFKAIFNPNGQITGSWNKVNYAKGYQVWGCDGDPKIDSNWRLIASSSTCKKILLLGLDRAKNNWLRVRAVRGKGEAGPWSNIFSLAPTE
ncbi:MAG TPA: hypothetical protein VJ550_09025 [Geomonas sp.]|nr:hypothetical protein [Geomonas sp.]